MNFYEPWQIEELIKCKEDPIYFCEKYLKINDIENGDVSFILRDYQKKFFEEFVRFGRIQIGLPRQMGKTSIAAALILHEIIFKDGINAVILAHRLDFAKYTLEKIVYMFHQLPEWIRPRIKTNKPSFIELENSSIIATTAVDVRAFLGKTINLLYIDEPQFIKNYHDIAINILPSFSGRNNKFIISGYIF